ncbi:MAG: hypothetical protein MJ120_00055 [Clostridia bacterium]|nr:hypothetical protein [Clostridia bacterium]
MMKRKRIPVKIKPKKAKYKVHFSFYDSVKGTGESYIIAECHTLPNKEDAVEALQKLSRDCGCSSADAIKALQKLSHDCGCSSVDAIKAFSDFFKEL